MTYTKEELERILIKLEANKFDNSLADALREEGYKYTESPLDLEGMQQELLDLVKEVEGSSAFESPEPNHPFKLVNKPNPAIDSVLQFFAYDHLPEGTLRETSGLFHDLAHTLVDSLPESRELTVCLRKLLEAKDAGVRSALDSNN